MLSIRKKRIQEKEIYNHFADYMFVVCARYVGERETAEELMNNGFIKVFKHRHKFKQKENGSLKSWVKTIMINECLMHLRKKKRLKYVDIECVENEPMIEPELVFEYEDLIKVFEKLPTGYKTVFNLYVLDNFSHREIAEKLGIKENTSRSQLTMAKKQLKHHLTKLGYVG